MSTAVGEIQRNLNLPRAKPIIEQEINTRTGRREEKKGIEDRNKTGCRRWWSGQDALAMK
jgi:hypothetical protein